MKPRQTVQLLPEGRRLHLQDGPIDLVIEAFGTASCVRAAYAAAARRFTDLLDGLCAELPALRTALRADGPETLGGGFADPVARAMHRACSPYASRFFITPMAAVAGAVADAMLLALTQAAHLDRAYVNNGGDIALHLAPGTAFTIGMVDRPDRPGLFGQAVLSAEGPVRGIATSGRHGRSFSLGIADAVTVLARNAATADAAATLIANAVDLPDHAAVDRVSADQLQPDSDLRHRLVTRHVGPLTEAEKRKALSGGEALAADLLRAGLILGAALHLGGLTRLVGVDDHRSAPEVALSYHRPAISIRDLLHA